MDYLFSIILPTFNRACVLWRAIQSGLAQTEVRWELLVINDGSTDNTVRLLEEFRDPRIRSFSRTHQGASAARNFAASKARASFLAYLDSDNTWHPEYLSTMLYAINSYPIGVLWYCGQNTTIWQRDNTGEWKLDRVKVDLRAQYTVAEVLQLQVADTSCMIHARSVLETIGGWDEACSFLEDWDLFARCIIRYPTQVYCVPKVMDEYRQVFGSEVDGLCATTVQSPDYEHEQWQYLIDKWQSQPGFKATAQQLSEKHLRGN
jgi:glycosyltransferase involved in cell wall biosynthesis